MTADGHTVASKPWPTKPWLRTFIRDNARAVASLMTLLPMIAEVPFRAAAMGALLALLAAGSVMVWYGLLQRWWSHQPLLEPEPGSRARWYSPASLGAVYLALLFTCMSLLPRISGGASTEASSPTLDSILTFAGIAVAIVVVLPSVLVRSGPSGRELGLTTERLTDQVRVGIKGYLAAVIPMAVSMAATLPFRGVENQHSLLKLLKTSPGLGTVLAIVVSAVVAAPLLEELLYRVILQGWLTSFLPAVIAIPVVAIVFCLVHGWRDGLALLPLAFILGYVFHRRHSYISVVVIHALFNATNLTLQLLSPDAQS